MGQPYMKLFLGDFHADTAHLDFLEAGAYFRLLTACWLTPTCSIPSDDKWIFRKTLAKSDEEKTAIREILSEFFKRNRKGRYYNPRQKEEFDKAERKRTKITGVQENAKSAPGQTGRNDDLSDKDLENNDKIPENGPIHARASEPEPEPEPEREEDDYYRGGDDLADRKTILKRCVDAAKPCLVESAIPLMDFSRPRRWLTDAKAPCDLELDIIPALEAVAAKAKPNSVRGWGYFQNAVIELRDLRIAGLPAPKGYDNAGTNNPGRKPRSNRTDAATEQRRDAIGAAIARRANNGIPEDDIE